MGKQNGYSMEFKATVAKEVIKGKEILAQLASSAADAFYPSHGKGNG